MNVSKKEAIKDINDNDYVSGWIISEIMSWGTEVNYQERIVVSNEQGLFVVKIGNKFFAINDGNTNYFHEVVPEIVEKLIFTKK